MHADFNFGLGAQRISGLFERSFRFATHLLGFAGGGFGFTQILQNFEAQGAQFLFNLNGERFGFSCGSGDATNFAPHGRIKTVHR